MKQVNFDKIAARYDELWKGENHDRPLIYLAALKKEPDWSGLNPPADLSARWMDPEYLSRATRKGLENIVFMGEGYPMAWPNLGPDILGAIFGGCEIEFGAETSWAVHNKMGLSETDIRFNEKNKWFRTLTDITEALVEDSRGDYMVGVTDLHAGLDALVSLRGPENLCFDLFDCPELVKERSFQVLEVFKRVFESQYALSTRYLPYTTNWMQIMSREREYVTGCDFSGLISSETYEEFVLPELTEELNFLDTSVYHLDGVQALTHLDRLCSIPGIKGIQWVPGAGEKPMREWLDVLKKIQASGKIVDVAVTAEDALVICEALSPEGIMMHCTVSDETEGVNLIRRMEQVCTDRRKNGG